MRLALSAISTVNASFAEDVAAYAAAGFDAIGPWEMKLPDDDAANLALLRGHGLGVANVVPLVPSVLQLRIPGLEGPPDPEERVEAICASIRRFAAYEPESILFLSGPCGDRDPAAARALVVEAVGLIDAVARETGVRVGFEPIHPSERESTGFVDSLAEAQAILDEARSRSVGLMLDTYHAWHEEDGAIASAAGRAVGLHVCDFPPVAGTGRLLPGETGPRAREIVDLVRGAGWDGSLDVEIFSTQDAFWGLPVDEAARRAYAAVSTLA